MKENINHGVSVSQTMAQYPKVFDTLTISLA
jgi:type II secretory pathway component PulF